ncbi:unnamed protein product [Candida verbasci]|uniref:RNA helicase n=1 Tax=Candida verbasci TaxID=1227364 RepID=A0A9W4TW05_9ASCO|nr:unnamed protein product [Candida verbasci]
MSLRQKRPREDEISSIVGKISVKDMGSNYKSETIKKDKVEKIEEVDQTFEEFLNKIYTFIPDASHEVIHSASELFIENLSSADITIQDKRKVIEDLLNVKINDIEFNDLINLAKTISRGQNKEEDNEKANYVAVEFNESEEEEIEDIGEEEPEEVQEEKEINWAWFQSNIPNSQQEEIISLLSSDADFESLNEIKLNEELLAKCTENRWKIVFTKKLEELPKEEVVKEMEQVNLTSLIQELIGDQPTKKQKTSRIPQRIDLQKIIFTTSVDTTKVKLPPGTFQENKKSYDIITIPPPSPPKSDEELVAISELPNWAQEAFPSNETQSFNRIQSKIYPKAFETNDNLLICAPTGAGKTNVAVLTILKTISNHRINDKINKNFKIVYIAPLKALVQEQMREFQRRLSVFGITVNELTGDSTLSKKQIHETQIIVTTPEKWDIITRKSPDYVNLVKLLIIDEIHLLHDERGPVLESIVSRSLRQDSVVRIVGLSATLPNYNDVAKFIRVNEDSLFYFDGSYRPCPLQQEFVGIKEKKAIKKITAMNEACCDRMYASLERNHQLIVFVHSRNETATTAKYLIDKLAESDINLLENVGTKEILNQESESMSGKLKEIIPFGFGIHHAGLNKTDRSTVEDLFAQGHLRVLVSTATLAWGVNLPAHTVIIKGTETYSPELGTWVQLSPQDILQMLGRAGRPRYDKNGEGIIITSQDEIQYYLALLNQQLPIESKLITKLVDSINAEIVAGSIKSIEDGIEWLGYTYFFIRMLQSPNKYGVEPDYDFKLDPTLFQKRMDLIYTSLLILREHKLIIFDGKFVRSTELGKIASFFYINYETVNIYGKSLKPWHSETDVLTIFSKSVEFKYIPLRQEEKIEINKLMEKAPIPVKELPSDPSAKINILLQTYISKLNLDGFALIADMIYIKQSAGRLLRAIYEISKLKKWSSLSKLLLNFCKMVENRIWLNNSPLRQFNNVPQQIIKSTEMSYLPWMKYFHLNAEELSEALNLKASMAKILESYVHSFPKLSSNYKLKPINETMAKLEIEILPEWNWANESGNQEVFEIFLEDCNGSELLYDDLLVIKKKNVNQIHVIDIIVDIKKPLMPNYLLSFINNKWVNCTWKLPILLNINLPKISNLYLSYDENEKIKPNDFEQLQIEDFNRLQSAVFEPVYNSNENVFIGSARGDGKITVLELSILNQLRQNRGKVVYLNSSQEIVSKLFKKWNKLFDDVYTLTGNLKTDISIINESSIILSTPEQFNLLTKRWKSKKNFKLFDLLFLDDLHTINTDINYEIFLTRLKMFKSQWEDYELRVVACSLPLDNVRDVCDWLSIPKSEIYNFPLSERSNNIKEIKLSIGENKHIEKEIDQKSIVFVPTFNKVLELVSKLDYESVDLQEIEKYTTRIQDRKVKMLLEKGIGIYYSCMNKIDQLIVEKLFDSGLIKSLIATKDTCNYIPQAHKVIIYGTSYLDEYEHRNIDYSIVEIAEMTGSCADSGVVHIYLSNANMIEYYNTFINSGVVIESDLLSYLFELLISNLSNGIIKTRQNCIDLLTYSFYYKRLFKNPSYYQLKDVSSMGSSEYLSDKIENVIEELVRQEFIEDKEENFEVLNKCVISSHYNLMFETMNNLSQLSNKSKLKDIIQIISKSTEFESLIIREGEVTNLENLQNKVPIKLTTDSNTPYYKTFILLQIHISRLSHLLTPDLQSDLKFILEKVLPIINGLVDLLSSQGYLNSLIVMDFSQMIVQSLWSSENILKQIPNIGAFELEKCKQYNVETVYDLMSLEDDERNDILQKQDDEKLNEIANFINSYPNIEVNYKMEGKIVVDEPKIITVTIDRDEELESLDVVSPLPFPKEENWWIVIGDKLINQLYAIKKINIMKTTQSYDLEVTLTNEGDRDLRIYLICDSYIDSDKEIVVPINV